MNDVEHRFQKQIGRVLRILAGVIASGFLLLVAGLLRADPAAVGTTPDAAAASQRPIWVSPISPYDPAEGTVAAHAVQIDASPHSGYVQTSAYAQTGLDPSAYPTANSSPLPMPAPTPAAAPEQLPPGGYLWGGTSAAPGPAGSYSSPTYSVTGSVPPPEGVAGPPPAGNLMGALGLGKSAPVGVPPLGPLFSDGPILAMPNISPYAIHSVFRLRQSITDEVGDDGPITSIGGFFPHTTDKGIWFFDGQFNQFEDDNNPGQQTENFGANLGLGVRWIMPELDSVAGLSAWYDLDRTRPDFVHQAAVSGEILGDVWQARINGYFPCGTNRISNSTPLGPAYYLNENIVFGQTRFDNLDMGGMDFEFGRRLPGWLGENGVSAYVGGYFYQADKEFNTFGVATRLEALVSPNLTFDAKFSSDPIFHNKIGLQFTWLLPNGKCKSCASECCSEVYRLTEPVVRNTTVVYATQTLNTPQLAINPATGTPIVVVHVNSAAPAGGNGTVNDPYNNLPSAQTGSAPNDIILVQGGSMFTGQGITLQNSQRFLGEGVPHTVDTVQEGVIPLPTVSNSTVLPVIANSPGNAVTLANSNEVSGFTINNSGGEAIFGNGISGTANINNVAINGGMSGIGIQNSSAAVTVTNVPIVGAATGVTLSNNTGSFDFVGTQTVSGSTVNGVALSGNSSPVTFDNLQVSATTGTALSATNQTGTLTITTGSVTASDGTGVNINNSATTAAPLAINLTSVNATGGTNGIALNNAGGTFTVNSAGTTAGSGGTISDTTGAAVAITGESGTATLNYMTITNPTGDGVDVANTAASGTVTLTAPQIALTGAQTGVDVTGNSGTLNLTTATVAFAAPGAGVGLNVSGSSGTENVSNFTSTNAATGVNLATDTGTFNGTGTTTVNGSTVNGVDLTTVSGPTSFGTLNVTATTGTGLLATNQTGTLGITAGTITASDGTGVNINNSAIVTPAPLAVTLTAVNATGGTNGIALNNAGGNFTVGTGTTAGSGGAISDTTGAGVSITGESGVATLNYMNITNPVGNGVDDINAAAGSTVTLTGTAIALNSAVTGVNVTGNSGTLNANTVTVTGGKVGLNVTGSTASAVENVANFSASGAATGINLATDAGAFNATGTTTVTGSTVNGVDLNSNTGAVSFGTLNVSATTGTGLLVAGQTGLLTVTGGTVTAADGIGVDITSTAAAGTPLAVTLQSVSATGGANGIVLTDAAGSFTVTGTGTSTGTGGTISNTTGDGIQISDELGMVSLSNMTVTSPGSNGVNIVDATASSIIGLTNLHATLANLDDVVATDNAGSITITNSTLNTANNYGLNLQTNTGTVTVANTTMTNDQLGGINVQNGSGSLTANNVTVTGGGIGVGISGTSGTATLLNLNVNQSNTGIDLANNTGTINFTGNTNTNNSATAGVDLATNSAAISFNNLFIDAPNGTGFEATDQTGLLTITNGNVRADNGEGLSINNSGTTAAPLAVALQFINSANGAYGLLLDNTGGTFTVNSNLIINTPTTAGVAITAESGTVTLKNLQVNNSAGDGVDIDTSAAGSTITLTNSQVFNTAGNGITVDGSAGTTTLTDAQVNNGTVAANSVGVLLESNTGVVNASNLNVNKAATGIEIDGSSAATNFTGNTTVTGSTTDGVIINSVTAPVTFATLNIDAPTGTGFVMENSATTLTITGGTINAHAGDAVDISGGATLAVSLNNVISSGGTNGINLNTVSGAFSVTDGTISNSSGSGILLTDVNGTSAGSILLSGIMITAPGGAAVEASASSNFTLDHLIIDTQTTGADGIRLLGDAGTVTVSHNTLSYGNGDGISVTTNSTGTTYQFDTNTLTTSGTGTANGIVISDPFGGNSIDESNNMINLSTAMTSSVGIEVFNSGPTADALSSTANNTVTGAMIPFSFLGSTTGTIEINGTPEP